MSIEFWILNDQSAAAHSEHVQNLLNQGWQRVFSAVVFDEGDFLHYVSHMQRDTAAVKAQNGVYMASLLEVLEVLEKRVAEVVERLEVVEATLDDDGQPGDLAAPVDWVAAQIGQQFIPVSSIWYREAVEEALAEDAALDYYTNWKDES